jgi:hypothetical protein
MVTSYQTSALDSALIEGGSTPYDLNSKTNSDTVRFNPDGSTEALGIQRFNATDNLNNNSEHPLGNAKDSYGRAVPYHSLTKDSLVTLGSTTATLEQLAQIGYAKQVNGEWEVVNPELVKLGEQQEAEQASIDFHNSLDLHPDILENRLNSILEPVPQPIYDNAISRFAETLDITKLDISGIAQTSGKTDEEIKKDVAFIQNTFTAQVESTLGTDTKAVMEWAKANKYQDLKDSMRQLLVERSLSGVKELHKAFQKDCSTEAQEHRAVHYLRSQGISVRKDGKSWVVKTDTGEMSLQNAFNQGYVKWVGGKGK